MLNHISHDVLTRTYSAAVAGETSLVSFVNLCKLHGAGLDDLKHIQANVVDNRPSFEARLFEIEAQRLLRRRLSGDRLLPR